MTAAVLRLTAVVAIACIGCTSEGDDEPDLVQAVDATVPLGELPGSISTTPLPTPPPPPPTTAPPEEPEVEPIAGQLGDVVTGNRLLLIGDSAMATLTDRREGDACRVLSALGWELEIEAENARYLPFADEVIDAVVVDVGDDWDVIGLMFGHRLDTSIEEFGVDLRRVLERLTPTPILLYTVTEDGDETMAELNAIIREVGDDYPRVVVVDWGAEVALEETADLAEDGLPTTEGMSRIVELTAAALGEPPGPANGACLEPVFADDSAIIIDS